MINPDFIICGSAKSGTTTIHRMLSAQEEVFMPTIKEIEFFSTDGRYQKGLQYYQSYFNGSNNNQIIGEASPNYMFIDRAPERIFEALPNVKLIFILRNPVDRAYSQYLHKVRDGIENLSFEDAVIQESSRCIDESSCLKFGYIKRSLYSSQLKFFLSLFPKENIKVLKFEELFNDIDEFNELCKWIGVKSISLPDKYTITNEASLPKNKYIYNFVKSGGGWLRDIIKYFFPRKILSPLKQKSLELNRQPIKNQSLDTLLRYRLNSMFKTDINELEKITGKDFSSWKIK
jgi:hypothetical protein